MGGFAGGLAGRDPGNGPLRPLHMKCETKPFWMIVTKAELPLLSTVYSGGAGLNL